MKTRRGKLLLLGENGHVAPAEKPTFRLPRRPPDRPPLYKIRQGNAFLAPRPPVKAMSRRKPIPPELREIAKRASIARKFPSNTCPSSRHLHMIADHLARGEPYPMLEEEPEHCAETMLWVLASLWELRTKAAEQ